MRLLLCPAVVTPRPWAAWAPRHMRIWAASARAMLGPGCAAATNVSRVAVAAPNATIPLLVLKYEDLVADPGTPLQRVLAFLGECVCHCLVYQWGAGWRCLWLRCFGRNCPFPPESLRAHGTWYMVHGSWLIMMAGQPPRLASCPQTSLQGSGQAKRESTGVTNRQYPACPYTQAMLHDLLRKAGPCFSALGYSLPPACSPVHAGVLLGGTDAVPVLQAG